ncbi:MAG UNVERIFIED_CONTAM: 50S ribosomal protein L24 [Rickettsiaceae bacterium]|jgi:large subunit ribosomal protein L24
MTKLKIRSGDKVIVTTGKDKGKTGTVLRVITKNNRLVVSGVNVVKRHTKPSRDSEGGIISKELSIHISNVAHVDPQSGKATKVGMKILKDGTKTRFAKKSGEIIKVEGK